MIFNLLVRFFTAIIRIFVRFIFKIETVGLENIPAQGGALVICNHVSFLDNLVLVASLPRQIGFVMAKKVFDSKLLNWALKRLPMVPVVTGKGKDYLDEFNKACQLKINGGDLICVFPEGQISRNGHLLGFKKGIEHICVGLEKERPIIPIHIQGLIGTPLSYDNIKKKRLKFRPKYFFKTITVSVGAPLNKDCSAFSVRQSVKDLEVVNFERKVTSEANLFKLALKNTLNENELVSQAELFVQQLSSLLVSYRVVAIGNGFSEREKVLVNLACAMLGKVMFNGQDHTEYVSAGVEYVLSYDDFSKCDLDSSSPSGELEGNTEMSGDLPVARFFSTSDYYSLTHFNMMSYLLSLKQLFDLGEGSVVCSQYGLDHPVGYFLRVWAPVITGSKVLSLESSLSASVLVGEVDFVNAFHERHPQNELRTIVLLDRHLEQLDERVDLNIVFNGLHSNSICPVLTLNSPDFEGRSLEGKVIRQSGKDTSTLGRPLPGIAVKVIDENGESNSPGELGEVLVKGAFFPRYGWIKSGVRGSLTEDGFLTT